MKDALVLFAIITNVFFCSCQSQRQLVADKEGKICGEIDSLSNFYQRTKDLTSEDLPSLVPTAKDADESILVIKELKSRLGPSKLLIGRSPQVLTNVISLYEPFKDADVERVSCLLLDIHNEYDTKPIMLRLTGKRQVEDKLTGEMTIRQIPFRQYVIE